MLPTASPPGAVYNRPAEPFQRLSSMNSTPVNPPPQFGQEEPKLSLTSRLVRLSLPTTTLGFHLVRLAGVVLGAIIGLLLFHFWIGAVVGSAIGFLASSTYLDWASGRQLRQFTTELPDLLLSLANALKASYSLGQAIERTAAHGHGLATEELQVSADQIALGARPLQAMRMLADRVHCAEMDYVILALGIHETVGGDLAKTLESAASTIQQRTWLQGEVRAATAEARVSSLVVCAIPLLFIFLITRLVPDYYNAMLASPVGVAILGTIGLLVLLAFYVVRKMQQAVEKI
jgi:tight adherence protein B